MEKELLAQIDSTKAELLDIYTSFSQQELNKVPFEGSWTAGQVGEHLLKACSAEILNGTTAPTTRDPAAQVETIRNIFLDFSTKMKSPDFIYPQKNHHEKEEIQKGLESGWTDLHHAASTLDLSQTCLDFVPPGLGALTRLEWLNFMVTHAQRHLHQLRNIYSKVSVK